MTEFLSKHVFLTGGASGIGRGLAEALAARGAVVTVAEINLVGAQAVAGGIVRAGGRASAVQLDVTDNAAFARLIDSAERLDYLFNNAGIASIGESRDQDLAAWRRVVEVNLMAVIFGSITAYQRMVRQGHGHIVNIASLAGLLGLPTSSAYATTKAGVVMLSRMLRVEGEALGVKVSVACPGFIRTGIYEHAAYHRVDKDAILAQMPFPIMELEPAVERILAGVERNEALILFPFYAKFFWHLQRWFPSLAERLGRRVMRKFRRVRE